MKLEIKHENQFLIISIVIIIASTLLVSWLATQEAVSTNQNERAKFLIELTNKQIQKYLSPSVFSETDTNKVNQEFSQFNDGIKNHDIIRIKAYNTSGKIIYSDQPELVGKIFTDDIKLHAALSGQTITVAGDTDEAENEFEQAFPSLLEIYLPFFYQGTQTGVFELYYDLSSLNSALNQMKYIILGTEFFSLTLMLVLLLWLYRRFIKDINQSRKNEVAAMEKISKLKDEFVFFAAHELRTPATIIKGCIDMIYNGNKSKKNTEKYITEINTTNNELIRLINDLLEIARSDSGKLNIPIASTKLDPIIKNIVEKFIPLTKQDGITIKYQAIKNLPKVMSNPEKIEEILNNLISNAIKYNKPAGKITISHEIKNDVLVTQVTDTGLGIKPEDQKQIFERFFRCSNTERNVGGTGLGLFITKELVERMHGRIWFTSEDGVGSTFSFELPICFCK